MTGMVPVQTQTENAQKEVVATETTTRKRGAQKTRPLIAAWPLF